MIKNSIYSYDYSQPADYRFSLDSVFLAQKVAGALQSTMQKSLSQLQILDLCAGCGVVGLELNFHLPEITKIDFLEIQADYLEHFNKNCLQAPKHTDFRFLQMNYSELCSPVFKNHYDIIISNPPYFFEGEGLLSPNKFKNRCRFFLDSSFEKLIEATLFSLVDQGEAFILMRSGSEHGRDLLSKVKELTLAMAEVEIFDEVRGTYIIRLIKKS